MQTRCGPGACWSPLISDVPDGLSADGYLEITPARASCLCSPGSFSILLPCLTSKNIFI